jgi:YcxB-like protein
MSEKCIASFHWTREEFIRAMFYHQRTRLRRGFRVLIKTFSAFLLLVIVALIVSWLLLPSTPAPPVFSFVLIIAFCVYWFVFDRINRWYWGRLFDKRSDANCKLEWILSKEEIKFETEFVKSNIRWPVFQKVVETPDGFLLYLPSNIFHWLPFSAFESDECCKKVREMIVANGLALVVMRPNKRLRRKVR